MKHNWVHNGCGHSFLPYGYCRVRPRISSGQRQDMSDADFDPDDIAELDELFTKITRESTDGFYIEMFISKLSARTMIKTWLEAILGAPAAVKECLTNYGYIVDELIKALEEDEQP